MAKTLSGYVLEIVVYVYKTVIMINAVLVLVRA